MDHLSDDLNESFFSCSSLNNSFVSADSESSTPLSLHDQLSANLSGFRNNFNVAHVNVQSIPAHYNDLLASFSSTHLDALLISESFLKPSLLSTQFALPGFHLIRNDRTGKGGGGVAVYLRSNVSYKAISASPSFYSGSAEHMFLEIIINHSKVLLAVFYSPNLNIDYFDSLENLLHQYCPLYDHLILMGDFNTCLLKNDARTLKLSSLFSSINLHLLPLSATHHFPNCTPSLLDLMVVSCPQNVATHGQLTASFSYHDLTFLSYRLRSPKRKAHYLLLRSYNNIDLDALRRDARDIDWSPLYSSSSIDEKVLIFNTQVLNLYDRHAPLKRTKVKHNPAPWLTSVIKDAMAYRDRAKRRYKRFPSETNLARYKLLRNRCSRMCRDAKRRHFHESLVDRSSADVWKFLKSVGIGKSSFSGCRDVDLNSLNNHFSVPPLSLSPGTKSNTLLDISRLPLPLCPPFSFCAVSEDTVNKSIYAISSLAVGNDGLCSKMITLVLPFLLRILTHIFNFSISCNLFPSAWKLAHVVPLPKVSSPSVASDFRPISILPFLSKVLEHIVQSQLSTFLYSHNLISPYQSGFRASHSTVTALINVTDDIRLAMEDKSLTVLVLLDFSSAFNSVDFDILLAILRSLNVTPPTVAWFHSYLSGRSQRVRLEETFSDWHDLSAGVPQGGVLSPLLFSIFINSVTRVLTCKFHLYADDLQLYRHFHTSNAFEAISAMNEDLRRVSEWAQSYGLLVNPNKTQALLIGGRIMRGSLNLSSLPPLVLNDTPIIYSSNAKNLGVIFDSNLSWVSQVSDVSRKVFYTFHSLKHLQNFLPMQTKILLAQSLILSIIDYADVCCLDVTEELLNKLERLQNLCIRFIFDLKKFDHVSLFRQKLKWLPIRLRRNTRILCLLFKILHTPSSPIYLKERFSYSHSPDVVCRSHLRTLLKFPSHKTATFTRSFTVQAVRLWNSLPPDIRGCKTIALFKKRVKEYYLSSSDT